MGQYKANSVMLITLRPQVFHNMPTTIEGSGVTIDCISGATGERPHMELPAAEDLGRGGREGGVIKS